MADTGIDYDRNPIWEPNWHDIIYVIRKAKWIIVACSILSAAAVLSRYADWRPSYVAQASISFLPRDVPYAGTPSPSQHPLANNPEIYAELQAARSQATLQRALAILAEKQADLLERHLSANGFDIASSATPLDEWILSNLKYHINLETREPFYIFDIDVASPSSEFSKHLANALARAYLDDRRAALEAAADAHANRLSAAATKLTSLRNEIPVESAALIGRIPDFLRPWNRAFRAFRENDREIEDVEQSLQSVWLVQDNEENADRWPALARAFELTIAEMRQRAETVRSELPFAEQINWVLSKANLGVWKSGRSEITRAVVETAIAAALGGLIPFVLAAMVLLSRPVARTQEQIERLLGWVHLADFAGHQSPDVFGCQIDQLRSELLIRKRVETHISVQLVMPPDHAIGKRIALALVNEIQALSYRVVLVSCSPQIDQLLEGAVGSSETPIEPIIRFSDLSEEIGLDAGKLVPSKGFEEKLIAIGQTYDIAILISSSGERRLTTATVSKLTHLTVYFADMGRDSIRGLRRFSGRLALLGMERPGFVTI